MNKKILTGALLVFIAGGLTGYLLFASFKDGTAGCVSEFTHINPEPDCEVFDERSGKLEALQSSLEAKVQELELQGDIDHVAVFTRDLTSRRFAGVNDDRVFVLASLLKVPIFIAYHKFAEVEPAVLTDEILYTGSPNSYDTQKEIPPSERLVVGQRYTVEELLSRMIIHSDNTASDILLPRMTESFMIKTLSSLGVQVEKNPGEKEALVTARTYANVFRGLYNASYLSREYSEKTLKLLTLTTFDRGTRGHYLRALRLQKNLVNELTSTRKA